MAKLFIQDTTLTAIGNAIREKTGTTDLLSPAEMATAIEAIEIGGGGADIPEEAFNLSGDCSYRFASGGWDWFLREYGNKLKTEDITNVEQMFSYSSVKEIPFDFNFKSGTEVNAGEMFYYCGDIEKVGDFINMKPDNFQYLFFQCNHLKELPRLINLDKSRMETSTTFYLANMFGYCYSLRTIPPEWLDLDNPKATAYTRKIYLGLANLNSLDELVGLYPTATTMTSGMLNNFSALYRIKNLTFKLDENGQPFVRSWKSQSFNITGYMGYVGAANSILDYSEYNGITADKAVSNSTQYQALKNDNDWFSTSKQFSRYNHDSAVNTINSLPDTSAYLASAGGTNNIKFDGSLGEQTDGGGINTLTAEEIAVASAKGWTVSFV